MRPKHQLLLAAFCLAALCTTAQKKELPLLLKSGSVRTPQNISAAHIDSFNSRTARFKNKAVAVLQFEQIPTPEQRAILLKSGIELLDYLPQNAYTVSISGTLNTNVLQKVGARSLLQLTPRQKMHAALAAGQLPPFAVKVPGTVDVLVTFSKVFVAAEVVHYLNEKNIEVLSADLQAYRVLSLRIAANRLQELAAFPFIDYVQPQPPEDQPLNLISRSTSGAAALNTSVASGGRGLNGEDVVMGIGDNADVQFHIDFNGRLINRAAAGHNAHGVHVAGTAAGAGIINEQQRGFAPRATIVSQAFSGIVQNAPQYVQDYGMVITNNSYGNIVGCENNGLYDLYSYILDQQAFDLPFLQHVFAGGNSGADNCAPYPQGFGTVLGGFQTAKNVLSVGNSFSNGTIAGTSSKGPVRDGRTKPEIATMGTNVISAWPANTYAYSTGTSMAAPAVSGGLALLYQRYRQLHNATPKSGLMKALLCNGATDKGPAGPDFSFGFGGMNLLRSLDMLEGGRFINGQSNQGAAQTHSINVPAGTAQLKVMLYWHDPAASLLSSQALVNDLDLEVSNGSTITFPKKLDPSPANITLAATTGADHINNMEQVVIDNPAGGTYTLSIKGTAITQNPQQEYYVVYDVIPVSTQLTYPAGGEALVPGEQINITWDAYGGPDNTFTLQYSTDNGANWINIETAVSATVRQYTWTVPAGVTAEQAKMRILRNGTAQESFSQPFTILGTPAVALLATQCEGYIALNWSSVAGATDYEVMLLRGGDMRSVATTTATTYNIGGLSKDSIYWVSVRARVNGKAGRRAIALSRQPNSGSCAGTISDNDLKLEALVAPVSGRKFTSTALNNAAVVQVAIKNLDDAPAAAYTVQYKINSGAWITESGAASIAAGAVYTHAFAAPVDLSATGAYTFTIVVKNNSTDVVTLNDTLVQTVKQLENAPINLTTDFTDDMETAAAVAYVKNARGLSGLDRYDFEPSTPYGRLRPFVNSGLAASGSKALTLDADRYYTPGNFNLLTGTYNLSAYNQAVNDIRLDFLYNNHGQLQNTANKVWIRGSDQNGWIEAFDLGRYQNNPGTYKKTYSIELSDLLANNGQVFTPSFQVGWGQVGYIQAIDRGSANGYTFDDIHLYEAFNDLQLLRIDTPVTVSCALSANTPVGISIRNSANTALATIPVKYRVNGGSWVSGSIGSIGGNATVQYVFTAGANLSAVGAYLIEAVVEYASDSYRENDTARITIINNPLITTYPYLQNFEGDNGSWYAGGKNSSWQYGTPASAKIKSAASGAKAWKTRLTGNHNDNEYSYLYSPCFDISTLVQPALSFSVALDLEDCGSVLCDAAWVEYSVDGKTWQQLTTGTANWYNKPDGVWSIENYTRWHVATANLPAGEKALRLRFVLRSDPAVNREGIAVDDIHIYDNVKGIYDGITMAAPITQAAGGSNWVHFEQDGKLVASVQPNGQDLGSTAAQAYLYTGPVRFTGNQYYHNRNITLKPSTTVLTDSATVRFYFLDTEAEALLNATGCNTCSIPASAYELGVTKWGGADVAKENGTIGDNEGGMWNFLPPGKVTIVPYDKGYYAEFKVADFSEFWLNNGSFDQLSPLPVKLLHFAAQKGANDAVLLNWTTTSETNERRFEVELARSEDGLQNNQFVTIGTVASKGTTSAQQQYSFTDSEPFKTGARYYRLKIVDKDGAFNYSPVRAVVFNTAVTWQVFPNPSNAVFQLVYQGNAGDGISAQVTDAAGRIIKEYRTQASGFAQKLMVELSGQAAGLYLLHVTSNGQTKVFKLYKQ